MANQSKLEQKQSKEITNRFSMNYLINYSIQTSKKIFEDNKNNYDRIEKKVVNYTKI